jgi:arsenical pump membrane protein
VTGLLMIGLVADRDGLFERAGLAVERLPGGTGALYGACLLLVASVTAVLNLDTAVVFLTPVLIYAARGRGVREEAFLYAAVFMANASSLFLTGSNLTNLIVLAHHPVSGAAFAAKMLPIALSATLATALGLFFVFRHELAPGGSRGSRRQARPGSGIGVAGALLAAALTVALSQPALPVLALGLALAAVEIARGRLAIGDVVRAVGPVVLVGLFLVSVALGVLARSWAGPSQLLGDGGRWGTTAVGALSSILINNLPSAVLLSSRSVAHPRALLLGLNVGPNLAATGSLSAVLWWRAAHRAGGRPSLAVFSRRGLPLGLFAMLVALAVTSIFPSSP